MAAGKGEVRPLEQGTALPVIYEVLTVAEAAAVYTLMETPDHVTSMPKVAGGE